MISPYQVLLRNLIQIKPCNVNVKNYIKIMPQKKN